MVTVHLQYNAVQKALALARRFNNMRTNLQIGQGLKNHGILNFAYFCRCVSGFEKVIFYEYKMRKLGLKSSYFFYIRGGQNVSCILRLRLLGRGA